MADSYLPSNRKLFKPELLNQNFALLQIVLKKWYTIYKDHIALEDYGKSLQHYPFNQADESFTS
jgi:hypothetical protein